SNVYGVASSTAAPLVVVPSGATTITFDDLPDGANGAFITNGYKGLNWDNFAQLDGTALISQLGPNGFAAGTVSPNNVGFNAYGLPATISSPAAPFNFYGAYFTAGWNDNLELDIQGYTAGSHLAFSKTVFLSATTPTLVELDFTNVTFVTFTSSG